MESEIALAPEQYIHAHLSESISDETNEESVDDGVTLYCAALDGDLKKVQEMVGEDRRWTVARITKKHETVLHIAAAAKHLHLVTYLVEVMDAASLALVNDVHNTALCFAAVTGIVDIARVMVEKNPNLPNIKGSLNRNMTPLHMAVLLGQQQMAEYLFKVTDLGLLDDQDRMALLTSSIDSNLFGIALFILRDNKHLATHRDAKGETALHALARKPVKCSGNQLSMWQNFKSKWSCITNQQKSDDPRIELALIQSLWKEVIKLRPEDVSTLIATPWRLLFVAAQFGNVKLLTVLIRTYPDVIWKVEDNNFTIFHIAVINRHEEIFKLIYEIGAIKDLITTYTDHRGNNMLHLASMMVPANRLNTVSGAALQMQREVLWFEGVKKIMRPEFAEAINMNNYTPQTLFTEDHEELRAQGEQWMRKTAESCALVATLIVTVVFSATFQLPGGVNSNGIPVLVKSPSFMVFAISDAISLFTSTASVLMFLSVLTSRYSESDFRISLPRKLMRGLVLLLISMATMIIAFTSTLFITFDKGVRWIPIPIALIAFIPVALFAFQHFPLLVDIYRSTYRSQLIAEPTKRRVFGHSSQLGQTLKDLADVENSIVAPLRHFPPHRQTHSDPLPMTRPRPPQEDVPTASQIVNPIASGQGVN